MFVASNHWSNRLFVCRGLHSIQSIDCKLIINLFIFDNNICIYIRSGGESMAHCQLWSHSTAVAVLITFIEVVSSSAQLSSQPLIGWQFFLFVTYVKIIKRASHFSIWVASHAFAAALPLLRPFRADAQTARLRTRGSATDWSFKGFIY